MLCSFLVYGVSHDHIGRMRSIGNSTPIYSKKRGTAISTLDLAVSMHVLSAREAGSGNG
jgi:hypothetical protein